MSALDITIAPALDLLAEASAPGAIVRRDELLADARSVTPIRDQVDADSATAILTDLTAFEKGVEAQRKAAKAPVLALTAKIDALGHELLDAVQAEKRRISGLLGTYTAEEMRKAREAQIKAENEAARIAAEARKAAEQAARTAATHEAADRAMDAIVGNAATAIAEVRQTAVAAVVPRISGTTVRKTVKFEVLDIRALYQAHPELVTLEPNGTAIRAILAANPNLQVPGLRHWTEANLNVRT